MPSELGKGPGLSKRSDLRRIDTGQYKKESDGRTMLPYAVPMDYAILLFP
ncbi:hypothetical protein M097_0642 [Phocaeicola vulgatus str. 3775 SL(B) 10 (iv)]|uniref:Uncharacterized protein n=1 Tax=Phocaeicola vulgatus str. 3775 SL(B) 10 (iv) TaxID=1339350 RepID=A0A078RHP4_PHOVU|nr:hypothetical protein M097_0642 [Phocaeicola vulgatus str. 3775 SL(B) 10 (iv)]